MDFYTKSIIKMLIKKELIICIIYFIVNIPLSYLILKVTSHSQSSRTGADEEIYVIF